VRYSAHFSDENSGSFALNFQVKRLILGFLSELSVTRAALWRERCSAKRGITVGRTGGRRRGAISDTFMGVFDSFLVAFGPNFGRIWQDEGGSRSAPQGGEQRGGEPQLNPWVNYGEDGAASDRYLAQHVHGASADGGKQDVQHVND